MCWEVEIEKNLKQPFPAQEKQPFTYNFFLQRWPFCLNALFSATTPLLMVKYGNLLYHGNFQTVLSNHLLVA